ncbi:MAG: hypothetical protein HC810_02480 [Acaryochloridaceae cyanobacterium RL_2_7]|nr:hypothetical protein [Acaryochloridaceae cyanobacterium RL_2_7]
MDNFSHFALMASISMILILLWRLNVAIKIQSELATSITNQNDAIAHDYQAAEDQVAQLTAAHEQITQANTFLEGEIEQQKQVIARVQSDHSALQIKYRELEQELLSTLTQQTQLSEQLHNEQLEKANLQRRFETLQERQLTQNKELKELQVELTTLQDKSKLYQQAVQAAKNKIETLEKDKKQLERDLQQALYQVVELEQHQTLAPQVENSLSSTRHAQSAEPSLPSFS